MKRYVVPTFNENKELGKIPNNRAFTTCRNGVFVGNVQEDFNVWKVIHYVVQPVEKLRFTKAEDLDLKQNF